MPVGIIGADSNAPVNFAVGGTSLFALATTLYGFAPQYWGRFFKGPNNPDATQYQPATEQPFFHASGLRLFPYARQTDMVSGSKQQGQNDAINNADAFLNGIGLAVLAAQGGQGTTGAVGREYLMLLDVEPQNPLSYDYYIGWATMLMAHSQAASGNQVTILPGVYMNYSDTATSGTLMQADADGVKCYGVSVAHYFQQNATTIRDWQDSFVGPSAEIPCATVMWQFFGDYYQYIDGVQLNPDPAISAFVTARMCVP